MRQRFIAIALAILGAVTVALSLLASAMDVSTSALLRGDLSVPLAGVYGQDDRVPLDDSMRRRFAAVGRIELSGSGRGLQAGRTFCSGSLVGSDLVLTNAHCLIDPITGEVRREAIWFRAGLDGDREVASSHAVRVWLGTLHPERSRHRDWAILRLAEPIGTRVGWLEVAAPLGGVTHRSDVALVGYAIDFARGRAPYRQESCTLLGFDARRRFLRHDCDINIGASGAPILDASRDRPVIVAVNAAQMARAALSLGPRIGRTRTNIAVGVSQVLPTLQAARAGE